MRADLKMGRELEPREIIGAVQTALPGMTVVDLTPYVSERGYGILNTLLKKKDKTLYVLPNCKGVRKVIARSGEPCKPGSIRHTFEEYPSVHQPYRRREGSGRMRERERGEPVLHAILGDW